MTELSFLLDLLLTKRLHAATKKVVIERIKEVEAALCEPKGRTTHWDQSPMHQRPASERTAQAASTQALLEKHGLTVPISPMVNVEPMPVPPNAIAQTPAAAAALQTRQQIINAATIGREEKGRTSPRKF